MSGYPPSYQAPPPSYESVDPTIPAQYPPQQSTNSTPTAQPVWQEPNYNPSQSQASSSWGQPVNRNPQVQAQSPPQQSWGQAIDSKAEVNTKPPVQQVWGQATTIDPILAVPVVQVQPIIVQNIALVPNYMAWSIFNIFCCLWPLGCVACFFSMQTDTAKTSGDIQGAIRYSRTARSVNIASTVLGLILITVYVIVVTTSSR